MTAPCLPDYFHEEILLHPENREFPPFDLVRLLGTVFEPTQGCRVCILIDFDEPAELIKDFAFLESARVSRFRKTPTSISIRAFRTARSTSSA